MATISSISLSSWSSETALIALLLASLSLLSGPISPRAVSTAPLTNKLSLSFSCSSGFTSFQWSIPIAISSTDTLSKLLSIPRVDSRSSTNFSPMSRQIRLVFPSRCSPSTRRLHRGIFFFPFLRASLYSFSLPLFLISRGITRVVWE